MFLTQFHAFLADATPAATGAPAGAPTDAPSIVQRMGAFPFLILMFVIMYFVLIRPQSVRAKQQTKMQEALKAGDRIVTASGIVGTVISVKDRTVSLRSMDAKMEVTRSSVTDILERSGEEKSEKTAS